MTTPQEGTHAAPEQAQPSTPATPEQPAAPQAPASLVTPSAPAISPEIQAQIDAANARAQQFEQQARYHQSRADQTANQLQAVVGAAPKADPLKPHLDRILSDFPDLDERAAKLMATERLETATRFSQLESNFNSRLQAPQAAEQALSAAFQTQPSALSDPSIAHFVRQQLTQAAMNGHPINPNYALDIAFHEMGRRAVIGQQAPPTQPQVQQPFNINGFTGPQGGFQAPAPRQMQSTATPEQLQLRAELQKKMDEAKQPIR
jgi:hypothetical protein